MDDDTRCKEEAASLRSIYAPGEFWCSADGRTWTALLSHEPRAELQLHLPLAYPSVELPAVLIDAEWLPPASVSRLSDELQALAALSPGSEIGFAWVQHAQQFVAAEIEGLARAKALTAIVDEQAHALPPVVPSLGLASSLVDALAPPPAPTPTITLPPIFSGEPVTDRKSTFQAHVARCSSAAEVRAVIDHLLADRKIARATHNQYAWRLWDEARGAQLHDNDDDGESGAGSKLAELLEFMAVNNVLVVVSRWYGGILLGSDRFKHIVATARDAIERAGLLASSTTNRVTGKGGAELAATGRSSQTSRRAKAPR